MYINFRSPKKKYYLVNILFYNIFRLCPLRSKHIWIFGALEGKKYDDNSKYMYEYVKNKYSNIIRPIWMTSNPDVKSKLNTLGYECYLNNSLIGKWYQLRAGVAFWSHSLMDFGVFPMIAGSEVVALFHGIGIKKIYNTKYKGIYLFIKKSLDRIFNWTYRSISISTSDYISSIIEKSFTLNRNKIYITGQPRNDALFKVDRTSVLNKIGVDATKKVVIYMPTYRHKAMGDDAILNIVKELYDNYTLNKTLTENNIIFIGKFHPLTPHINISNRDNFRILDYKMVENNQDLLAASDMLITDVSTCFIDYALLGKPICFYMPDEEKFRKYSEDIFDEFFDINKLNKAITPEDLAQFITNPNLNAVNATNKLYEDPSIKGTCYSENVYNAIIKEIGL